MRDSDTGCLSELRFIDAVSHTCDPLHGVKLKKKQKKKGGMDGDARKPSHLEFRASDMGPGGIYLHGLDLRVSE